MPARPFSPQRLAILCLALFALAAAGCAGPKSTFKPTWRQAPSIWQGADAYEVTAAPGAAFGHYTGSDQVIQGAGILVGGVLGSLVGNSITAANAKRRGVDAVRENALRDPSEAVARQLQDWFGDPGQSSSADRIKVAITTRSWWLSTARLTYYADMVVTDATGRRLALSQCEYSPTLKQLHTTSATLLQQPGLLRAEYDKAAGYCASFFNGKLFPDVKIPQRR